MVKTLIARAGYRYSFKKQELGYAISVPRGVSAGFGLDLSEWSLDYSITSFGDLGLTHHLNMALKLKS